MEEPKHPTYGTLDNLLSEIAKEIRQGYCVRIGHAGALHWFEREYGGISHDESARDMAIVDQRIGS